MEQVTLLQEEYEDFMMGIHTITGPTTMIPMDHLNGTNGWIPGVSIAYRSMDKTSKVMTLFPPTETWEEHKIHLAEWMGDQENLRIRKEVLEGHIKGEEETCNSCQAKAKGMMRCGGCKMMWYCDKECQRKDWKFIHKATCNSTKEMARQLLLAHPEDLQQKMTTLKQNYSYIVI